MLLKFLVMRIEITEFIWKNVSIRYKIEVAFTKLLLHTNHVIAESVLASDLIALREMVDFLILIETLI